MLADLLRDFCLLIETDALRLLEATIDSLALRLAECSLLMERVRDWLLSSLREALPLRLRLIDPERYWLVLADLDRDLTLLSDKDRLALIERLRNIERLADLLLDFTLLAEAERERLSETLATPPAV